MSRIFKISLLTALLVMWGGASAMANFFQPNVDPVSIWAVDCYDAVGGGAGQDHVVVLNDVEMNAGTILEYSYGGSAWTAVANNTVTISGMTDCKEEVFFRLQEPTGGYDYSGDLTFSGDSFSCCSLPVTYNNVMIDWGGATTALSLVTVSNCDKLAPVPVPASAFMLFSGIVGLFVIRRRRRDE